LFFVFRGGHALITSSRKNCGDLQTSISRDRDHNPVGAARRPGMSRNLKSFISASGTGICSSLSRSHLIAVI